MRTFRFVVERDPATRVLVGHVPGWPGAHTQRADIDELQRNLREVIEMLLEDGEPSLESEFVDVRTIQVAGEDHGLGAPAFRRGYQAASRSPWHGRPVAPRASET